MVVTDTPSRPVPPLRRGLVAALAGAVVAGLLGWLLAPVPSTPGPETTGDPALAERLRAEAGPGRHGLVAAVVRDGQVTVAGIGDDGHGEPVGATTPFEVGSITKTFTGALLVELERRGVVRADERVRDVVPDRAWRPGGVGDVTLAELASHRSGLPRLATGPAAGPSRWARSIAGFSPYDSSVEELLAAADRAELSGRGEYLYSNLGSALLGQALAARAGTPYPQLVSDLVTAPLGMTGTAVLDAPPPGAARSHDLAGRPRAVWISEGDAPAGIRVWSTAEDLVRYVGALDDPASAVAEAARPRFDSDLGRVGYGWETLTAEGRTFLWKNGGVAGTWATILTEPARGQAVVVFGNSTLPVDDLAVRLLDVPSPFTGGDEEADTDVVAALLPLGVGAVFPLLGGLSTLVAARGGWRGRRPVNRLEFLASAGTGLFFLAAAYSLGGVAWVLVPSWLAGCVAFGAGAGLAAVRWPGWSGGRSAARWANAAVGAVLGAGAAGAITVAALLA